MEARQEIQHPYMNAVQNKQEEMQRLLQIQSLLTESETAMKYNEMMNNIIAYKKKLQPQVALQPPINIPHNPNILQEVQPTPQLVRKRPSLLTPPATVDPAIYLYPALLQVKMNRVQRRRKNGSPFRTMKKKKANLDNIGLRII